MQNQIQVRLSFAKILAKSAGDIALKFFNDRDQLDVDSKGLQDRVTIADKTVEEHIFSNIQKSFPDDSFLGEESGTRQQPENDENGTWVVDPIDGTNAFVFGIPAWCISIAWMKDGRAEIGVIYDPIHDELYAAATGHPTKLNNTVTRVRNANSLSDGFVGLGASSRADPDEVADILRRLLKAGGIHNRCGSSALSIAWVSVGRLLGYYGPHLNSWDCLAGIVLVREAGGWASDFLINDGLNKGNPLIVCTPGITDSFKQVSGRF